MRKLSSTCLQDSNKTRIFDEKQQKELIQSYRRDAANFDRFAKWMLVIMSIVLVGVAFVVLGEGEEQQAYSSLRRRSSSSGSFLTSTERRWLAHGVCLSCVLYGLIRVIKFQPEKDWMNLLHPEKSTNSVIRRYLPVLKNFSCAIASGLLLVVQMYFLSNEIDLSFANVMHSCAGSVLGLVHGIVCPLMIRWMAETAEMIDVLEKKKYHLSEA